MYGGSVSSKSRITPAGAGKTEVISIICPLTQDHPRRCGENLTGHSPVECFLGSPPQVRGKPKKLKTDPELLRITPAGAGKTRNI